MKLFVSMGLVAVVAACAKDEVSSAMPSSSIPVSHQLSERELFDKGYIKNPFSSNSGYLDIRGIPVGMTIRDPYSGKTFTVKEPK